MPCRSASACAGALVRLTSATTSASGWSLNATVCRPPAQPAPTTPTRSGVAICFPPLWCSEREPRPHPLVPDAGGRQPQRQVAAAHGDRVDKVVHGGDAPRLVGDRGGDRHPARL